MIWNYCRKAIGYVPHIPTHQLSYFLLLICIFQFRVISPRTKNLHTRAHRPTDIYHSHAFYLKRIIHYNDDRLPRYTNHRHPYNYLATDQHMYVHLSKYTHLHLRYDFLSTDLRKQNHLSIYRFLFRVSYLVCSNQYIWSHLSRFQLLLHVINRLCSDLRIWSHSNVCILHFHLLYCPSIRLREHLH